jgi:uncharacterized protein YndB with AHSA1/START domain
MSKPLTAHDMFRIERFYPASPQRVFAAFAEQKKKDKWFASPGELTLMARSMDFREGGRERAQGRWGDGTVSDFNAVYFDIQQDRRIVYAYEMHINAVRISVSLGTIEFEPDGAGTKLIVTEQGAFVDGYKDSGSRKEGTGQLLDAMARSLAD